MTIYSVTPLSPEQIRGLMVKLMEGMKEGKFDDTDKSFTVSWLGLIPEDTDFISLAEPAAGKYDRRSGETYGYGADGIAGINSMDAQTTKKKIAPWGAVILFFFVFSAVLIALLLFFKYKRNRQENGDSGEQTDEPAYYDLEPPLSSRPFSMRSKHAASKSEDAMDNIYNERVHSQHGMSFYSASSSKNEDGFNLMKVKSPTRSQVSRALQEDVSWDEDDEEYGTPVLNRNTMDIVTF